MGMVFGRIDVEIAPYEVLRSPSTDYEIRRYAATLVAETDASEARGGDRAAFRRLAKYIGVFGESENASKEKISMTAPVFSSDCAASSDDGSLAFTMPAKYTKESLPAPMSADVHVKELPERTVACVTFSGTVTKEDAALKAAALEAMLLRDGLQLAAAGAAKSQVGEEGGLAAREWQEDGVAGYTRGWTLARFNPPWTLPFLKTNEVLVPIVLPLSTADKCHE